VIPPGGHLNAFRRRDRKEFTETSGGSIKDAGAEIFHARKILASG
jgi:hypothetical protein